MEKNNTVLEKMIVDLDKMAATNNKVDINSMYGIFLPNNDRFIVCKEDKFHADDYFYLKEFFTNEFIAFNEVGISGIIYPWRRGRHYSLKFLTMAYGVPIVDLLGKFSVNEAVTEKDIACLYANVNKYINENPNFIKQLFDEEKEKVR